MEKEYTVIAISREALKELEKELQDNPGENVWPIPDRSVQVANPRIGSKIQTHFMLTDDEVEYLKTDPRVRSIEIPPEQRDDIQIGIRSTQYANFYRGTNDANDVNWGLRRCVAETNVYGANTTLDGAFNYAIDGTGVDVVIQDSGIDPDHPEWESLQGGSRLVQVDWYNESGLSGTQSANHYRDRDGHGTHVAGTIAGKTYGWVKNAAIYSQKLAGLETLAGSDGTGIGLGDAFDAIRLWHNKKNDPNDPDFTGRPTVVNMSWGYSGTHTGAPASGIYRGTPWTYNSETDNQLWDTYGIVATLGNGTRSLPAQVASVDAEIDDMIADGIHIVIAAGNDYYKADVSSGNDYDNEVTFGATTRYYHRPSSPYSEDAFIVGNIDSDTINDGANDVDRTAGSSKKGPAVNIWAPGSNIMAPTSTQRDSQYDSASYDYPLDNSYEIMSIGGTSMAAPQVAGVIAQHLQVFPNLTPSEMKSRVIGDTKSVIYETANNDTDYRAFTTSILGSPNRMLFSKYGKQPLEIANNTSLLTAITVT